jgi:hypothetical protein
MQTDSIRLFRPVGQKELDLISESGFTRFPPRLPEQPIFYPVLNIEYAEQIARDWNTRNVQDLLAMFWNSKLAPVIWTDLN